MNDSKSQRCFLRSLAFCLATVFPAWAGPSDWHNYLGPGKNSVSPDPTPLAESWPAGGPPELWSIEMHPGHGGAAIVDGKVYLVQPDPKGYRQLAVANPFGHTRRDLKRWAPLAISKGLLIIRDERELRCLDLRKH